MGSSGKGAPGESNPMAPMAQRGQQKGTQHSARWNSKAWDAYEYRANVPTLKQFDRDRSARGKPRQVVLDNVTQLIRPNVGDSRKRRSSLISPPQQAQKAGLPENHGSNAGGSESKEVKIDEGTADDRPEPVKLKEVGRKSKDKAWVGKIRKGFVGKFYTSSTLASKNTKRKKIIEILDGLGETFPLSVESMTTLAAVLDSTGMKAGDQYLSEAKAMHIEENFEWTAILDRQMNACKRAMNRDKGPEHRAKEVKVQDIDQKTWSKVNFGDKEPRRVAWSYAWATIWMMRSIEAAQISAKDVVVDLDEKIVRHFIPKSKTDQKASGTWRTLKCCGRDACDRHCPVALAVNALNDLKSNECSSPLFPDSKGNRVSKFHMVTAWAANLDKDMTGHSARRSGAMAYARMGMSVHHIQFLGRWKSSAVFRYIEEAMTEIPLNDAHEAKKLTADPDISEATRERKALRPKAKSSPKKSEDEENLRGVTEKPLVNDGEKEEIFAVSNTRGKWVKHLVGQAAWGIPLDNWSTLCGWQFARRNVKVELTKRPCRSAVPCKKCFKQQEERDGVRKAREWAQELDL